jgi:hypothetical protein
MQFPLKVATALCVALAASTPAISAVRAERPGAPRAVADSLSPTAAPHAVRFERNEGQFDPRVAFVSRDARATVLFARDEIVFRAGSSEPLRMILAPTAATSVEGERQTEARSSYFVGSDPSRWRRDVASFERVRYRDLAPGVDAVFYSRDGELEYDLVVAPGADPSAVRFAFEGGEPRVESRGDLVVEGPGAQLRHRAPVAYTESSSGRTPVATAFAVDGNRVGFSVGSRDVDATLVIDPPVVFSTAIGGNAFDDVEDVAIGLDGSVYVTGITASVDFPTLGGAQGNAGGDDLFVAKFAPGGTKLLYSTYLGGSQNESSPNIALEDSGAVTLIGTTASPDYPVRGAVKPNLTGFNDVAVTRISPDGSALLFSTYFGGSGGDIAGGVAVRLDGSVVIVGTTTSQDFPVVGNSQPLQGFIDGFVAELAPGGAGILGARLFGGTGLEYLTGVVVGSDQRAYVCGYTQSTDFPGGGGTTDGTACLVSFMPGVTLADARTVAFDLPGAVYIGSIALHGDELYLAGTLADPQNLNASSAIFMRTDLFGTKTGARIIGSTGTEEGNEIAVDPDGNVTVVGLTTSTDGFITFAPAFQQTYGGGNADAFYATYGPDLGLREGGYLGGGDRDVALACATDTLGNVYIGGYTGGAGFATTAGVYQGAVAGGSDGYVVELATRSDAGAYQLDWLAPDPNAGALAAPRGLVAAPASAPRPNDGDDPAVGHLVGYNVYRSAAANVLPSKATYYFSVQADRSDTGPVVAGGGYYYVTAVYSDGSESAPTNIAAAGVGEAEIRAVRLKPAKVVALGSGFSATVQVFVDGIGFAAPARIRNGKVIQTGALDNGQTVAAYLDAHGGAAALTVVNEDGAPATFRLRR